MNPEITREPEQSMNAWLADGTEGENDMKLTTAKRPAWWPTKAQKERADEAHRDTMKAKAVRAAKAETERLIGPVVECKVTTPVEDGRNVEGIVMAARRVVPLSGLGHCTLRWAYNRETGDVGLFWGHYDLSLRGAREDYATRVNQDR